MKEVFIHHKMVFIDDVLASCLDAKPLYCKGKALC